MIKRIWILFILLFVAAGNVFAAYPKNPSIRIAFITYSSSDSAHVAFAARHGDLLINPNWSNGHYAAAKAADSDVKTLRYTLFSTLRDDDSSYISDFVSEFGYDPDSLYLYVDADSTVCIDGISGFCPGTVICTSDEDTLMWCGHNDPNRYSPNFLKQEAQTFTVFKYMQAMDADGDGTLDYDGVMVDEAPFWRDGGYGYNYLAKMPFPFSDGKWVTGTPSMIRGWDGITSNATISESLIVLYRDSVMSKIVDSTSAYGILGSFPNGAAYGRTYQPNGIDCDLTENVYLYGDNITFGEGMDYRPFGAYSLVSQFVEITDSIYAHPSTTGRAILWYAWHTNEFDSLGNDRFLMYQLSHYYSIADTSMFFMITLNFQTNFGHAPYGWGYGEDSLNYWTDAMAYNIGYADSARFAAQTGTDPAGQGYTIYRRDYTEPTTGDDYMVLVRQRQGGTFSYAGSSVYYTLPDTTWKVLGADTTWGYSVDSVAIANIEGMILKKDTSDSVTLDAPNPLSPDSGSTIYTALPTLQWSTVTYGDASSAVDYGCQVDDNDDFSSTLVDTSLADTSLTLVDSLSETTWYWRVLAYKDADSSSWSNTWEFDVLLPPDAPTLTSPDSADTIYTVSPSLYWNEMSGATSYQAEVDDDDGFGSPDYGTSIIDTSWTLEVELEEGRWYWRARAQNEAGWGEYSDGFWFYLLYPPEAPVLYKPDSASVTTDSTPTLQCIGIYGNDKYYFQLDDDNGFASPIRDDTLLVPYYTVSPKLTDYISYYWRVQTHNDAGWSDYSNIWFFDLEAPATPDAPKLVYPDSGSVISDSLPDFKWNEVADADSYQIRVDDDDGFGSTRIDTVLANAYFSPSSGLGEDTTWYWGVRAWNISGWGSYSNTWNFSILLAPSAPDLLSPDSGGTVYEELPTLDWKAVSGTEIYEAQLDTSKLFLAPVLIQLTDSTHCRPVSPLSPDTYYWRVRGYNDSGHGDWSNMWNFIVVLPPDPPILIYPTDGDSIYDYSPTLRWSTGAGASAPDSFYVMVDDDSLLRLPDRVKYLEDSTSWTVTADLTAGKWYWGVIAHNAAGWGDSDTSSFTIVAPEAPVNDDCADAITVGEVSGYHFSTAEATASGLGSCISTEDVWYIYTPTCAGRAAIEVYGTTYDPKVAVYQGTNCGSLTQLGCNDNYWDSHNSKIIWNCNSDSSYLIQIGASDGTSPGDGYFVTKCVDNLIGWQRKPASSSLNKYVGVNYQQDGLVQYKYITQEVADSSGIQMVVIHLHWGLIEDYTAEQIRDYINNTMAPGNYAIWLKIREGHSTKARLWYHPNLPNSTYDSSQYSAWGRHQGPVLEEYRQDWINFCGKMANALGDRVDVYQIGNEPNGMRYASGADTIRQWLGTPVEWAENIMLVTDTIKKVDPTALIVPGGTGWAKAWRDPWYMEGANYLVANEPLIDGLDLHYYGQLYDNLNQLDSLMYNINAWCAQRGLRWSVSEVGAGRIGFSDYMDWGYYDILRQDSLMSQSMIHGRWTDSLRTLNPDILYLPENAEAYADSIAKGYGIFTRMALRNGALASLAWGEAHKFPSHWYSAYTPGNPLWKDRNVFYHNVQVQNTCFYTIDSLGVERRNPICDTLRAIIIDGMTNPR